MLFMHDDAPDEDHTRWGPYLAGLRQSGLFDGGSSIGDGASFSKRFDDRSVSGHLVGYLLVRAASVADARRFLDGNPTYDAGGTVEIRELTED